MPYNWQLPDWPHFAFDLSTIESTLLEFVDQAGEIQGLLQGLSANAQMEIIMEVMISEALKTSSIEGEYLDRQDIKSSIRNHLGLNSPLKPIHNLMALGVSELMLAVRETWDAPLSEEMLFTWHHLLMNSQKGILKNAIGCWRTHSEPMQVVSGRIGHLTVHYEAPPSCQIPTEMTTFIQWFNSKESNILHAPVRSALTHLYFESIHPFEDGNGRIGRALSEKALSQGLQRPVLLSLSQRIEANKTAYYDALHLASRSNEVTGWIQYFATLVLEAQKRAKGEVAFTLKKAQFFDQYGEQLNPRQMKAIQRMFQAGLDGFEGGMNARKYRAITKTSKATATRDLQDLATEGILLPIGGGRSTRYELKNMC